MSATEMTTESGRSGTLLARRVPWFRTLARRGRQTLHTYASITRELLTNVPAESEEAALPDQDRDMQQLTMVVETLLKRHYVPLPLPPRELRLHVGTRTTAANYWAQGLSSSSRVMQYFGESPTDPILDWGCGCGRTLRWLLGHEPWREQYRGCDVDGPAVKWLRKQTGCELAICRNKPPLPYEDASLGGLFSFSVLTHIRPEQHRDWYADIRRVLRPGAMALLTVQGSDVLRNPSRYRLGMQTLAGLERDGHAYIQCEGHYKDASLVTEAFTRAQLEDLFTVEEYSTCGYQNMDLLLVRRSR